MFADTLGMRLRGAYLTFHRRANAQFEALATAATADQFVVLTILAGEGGLTQREVVDRAYSDPNTIGAILTRLERKGLVRREPHPRDGRARCVHLTTRGRRLQQRLEAGSRALHERLDRLFTRAELETLRELLARVPPAMAAARTPPSEDVA
jgi:DNA-binding MarR family transcriptional regulator